MTPPLLSIQGLTKVYPGVVANKDVTFDIGEGEVHALLGENGAGKSTLVKAIYGLIRPNEGTMLWRGQPYAPNAPAQARATGVAMVFQHFSLFDAMDVAENVALGMDNPPPIRELAARITEVSNNYGLPLDPSRMVGDLSAGERQRVEIIRCLLQNPQLLIMDEPTSVLTPQEVEILFRTLRQLRAEGRSILYISHKLEEIRSLCENATVLRLGKVVGRADPRQESARSLAEMMVGQTLHTPSRPAAQPGKMLLQVTDLSVASPSAFGTSLKSVSLAVRAGEILGIGGVAGNGQDELLGALSGEIRANAEAVRMAGEPVGQFGPNARRAMGLLCAPEERLGHAAAPDMSLTENALLTGAWREKLVTRGFVNWGKARGFAEKVIERFDVRTPGPWVAARALSGGNLQKFVIGREILQRPSVLVVNQPTWGVDASAAASIRQALLDLAQAGAAVVVISQDLDEILEVADNFAALNGGKLSAPRPVQGLTMDQIGLMLGGAETGETDVAA
ncbi:ABC transporter ATP-binding protein [Pararhodobacter aggregans]|uniref:ABC transporter n=1 Tax=Pararhodobacter aggregans TaxID=404875 RepID=A0A2T7UVD9_9RHOB|nr:ABC transporter ATP-binding protein [Pararhodobacter aggregans]PTX03766.1 nucleoside ABC transporter ATP-binding protein [Pararhodobacter aggregans]PVE48745.1 ABC transporter [Pararhodobacter aggregans]